MRGAGPGEVLGDPDREAFRRGHRRVCGLDEVGRGPLAGPVVAAAVVLPPDSEIRGVGDSKRLSPAVRARLVPEIREAAMGVGLGIVGPAEIDRINILEASLLAMVRALENMAVTPDFLLVDGVHPVRLPFPQQTLVGGDRRSVAIAAASIVAKEYRDDLMREYARAYPGYGFETHKGYPTAEHRQALLRLGPTPIHRVSFRGVREAAGPVPQRESRPGR